LGRQTLDHLPERVDVRVDGLGPGRINDLEVVVEEPVDDIHDAILITIDLGTDHRIGDLVSVDIGQPHQERLARNRQNFPCLAVFGNHLDLQGGCPVVSLNRCPL
jgi:hypothetical protein